MSGARLRIAAVVVTMLIGLAASALLGAAAHAQGTKPRMVKLDKAAAAKLSAAAAKAKAAKAKAAKAGAKAGEGHADAPKNFKHSRVLAPLFWIFALLTVGGALFVITRRNLVAAVMGMVGTFFAIAVLYVMLYAHFIAVIQVLVYAGAIMVLFVFVIMILNRPVEERWARQGLTGKALAVLGSLYLLVRISGVLWGVEPPDPAAGEPPKQIEIKAANPFTDAPAEMADFGSTKAVGKTLFGSYLFPFEAVSLVLLLSVVGAIVIARPNENRETAEDDADDDAGEREVEA